MEMPSFALSPVAPVRFSLSDPARSTKWNLAVRVSYSFISEDSDIILLSVALSWSKEEPTRLGEIFHINICKVQSTIIYKSTSLPWPHPYSFFYNNSILKHKIFILIKCTNILFLKTQF